MFSETDGRVILGPMAETILRGRRIGVLGAGPVGLETALQAAESGADVRVCELGASDGRNPAFLLHTGYEQIRNIAGLLAGRATAAA